MQTFTASEYLKIDIANAYGHDKWTWDKRIAWFDKNESRMHELLATAKEPAMFYAGCQAYVDALNGTPSGYMISLDATSSGLQLLALLTGCRKSAQICNVVPMRFDEEAEIQRCDGYTVLFEAMLERAKNPELYDQEALGLIGEDGSLLAPKVTRDDTKQAIMTALYSSKAQPKKIFGEGGMLDVFYDTMNAEVPGAWELNEAMPAFWNPEALSHDWVLPDNFHVKVKVMDHVTEVGHFLNTPYDVIRKVNEPTKEGRSLGANTVHSIDGMVVREMGRRCDYDVLRVAEIWNLLAGESCSFPVNQEDEEMVRLLWDHYERTGFLSARILDHIRPGTLDLIGDLQVLKDLLVSLPAKPFKVLAVHDCFRCHPNYGNDLRQQYANILSDIGRSELLSDILSQLTGRAIQIGKLDPEMWQDVKDTEYALS